MDAIAILDAEIGKLEAQLAGLRHARQILDGPCMTAEVSTERPPTEPTYTPTYTIAVRAEPPAKKPVPPAAPSRSEESKRKGAGPKRRHEANRERRRHELAKRIAAEGPMKFARIETVIPASAPTIHAILHCPYFEKTDPTNRLSPWTLTESGRRFAESSGPG